MGDMVHFPSHYIETSVTLEPIDVLRYAPFDLGNALKYIIRAGHKGDELQDWEKAKVYLEWVEERLDGGHYEVYKNYFDMYGLLLMKFPRVKEAIGLRHPASYEWVSLLLIYVKKKIKLSTGKN